MLVDEYSTNVRYNNMKTDLTHQITLLKQINECYAKETQTLRNRTYRQNKQIKDLKAQLSDVEDEGSPSFLLKKKKPCCVIM